ncbi:MAG: ATP-dependent sacrificial sulfur transferase LarE [Pseudomonadales bacterium]|nr:ATP-dependent sacrificial sulfur transferase LarE [Pseudomonadales bacterium]
MSSMTPELEQKYGQLEIIIRGYGSAVVAFSGGIDSSLVAYVAGQVLGKKALAVTSGSASLKRTDLALSKRLSEDWGIAHQIIVTDELSKADYRANPTNRCFHCKTSLYTELEDITRAQGYAHILNGTNLDDLGDHRPGLIAADNHAVKSPLVEAGFHKSDIRALAKHLGLENADKPQAACLSSRFPYGTAINQTLLAQVEAAENVLASYGFSQFRVRHHGEVARLEILREEFELALQYQDALQSDIQALGYRFVAMDLGGFRSGSLNEGLSRDDGAIPVVNIYP